MVKPRSNFEPRPTNLALANGASPNSYLGIIIKSANAMCTSLIDNNPDARDNKGRILGEAFFWDEMEKYCAAKSKQLWKQMEDDGIYDAEELSQGSHVLTESRHFVMTADVSKPVERFDADVLANWFAKSKYKVPVIIMKEQLSNAKVPTKSVVKLKIIER